MTAEKMRGKVVKFREGFALIDDCYNSNPKALSEMIRLLVSMPGFDRRILVAGEMHELGKDSGKLHANCGKEAVKAGVDFIIGVGPGAEFLIEGARDAGANPGRLKAVHDAVAAGDFLTSLVKDGDLVLLKGSRRVRLEQAVNTLRLSFSSLEP